MERINWQVYMANSIEPASNCVFQVVILYEDIFSLYRAFETCNLVRRQLGEGFSLNLSLWHFREFETHPKPDTRSLETAEAELWIVALRTSAEAPSALCHWLAQKLLAEAGKPRALVVLSDLAGGAKSRSAPAHRMLRKVAQRAQMDFFATTFDTSTPLGPLAEKVACRCHRPLPSSKPIACRARIAEPTFPRSRLDWVS